MFNDAVTDSENAFMGMAISDTNGGIGNVQLWNPLSTGKLLYVDKVIINGDTNVGADIRFCKAAAGTLFPDHSRNKKIDGPAPKAEIRTYTGNPPMDYPYNRPVQEVWMGGLNNDRAYTFDPPILVPQGRGILVGMAGNSKCFASFQWREIDDPQGPIGGTPGLISGSEGTINTDMTNGANAFDTDIGTYANDNAGTSMYIGKIWSVSRSISRFVVKSPSTRSFSGGNPGRVFTWTLETWNGSTWNAATTGNYTEPGTGGTQSVIDISYSVSALGHRVKLVESAAAAHRIALLEFYS